MLCVIFLGDYSNSCNVFLDYDTDVELEWSINKKLQIFSSKLYSPPE